MVMTASTMLELGTPAPDLGPRRAGTLSLPDAEGNTISPANLGSRLAGARCGRLPRRFEL